MLTITWLLVAQALAGAGLGPGPRGTTDRVALAGEDRVSLEVPYLPQTEALCGGAAAAMVFRFWGDRHASIQQFAPLVNRPAGGPTGIVASDLVEAVARRGWRTDVVAGSVNHLRDELAAGHPLILLLEDRPARYHFLVAVAADEASVWLHDPTWGPSRAMRVDELLRRWKPANYWSLRILPGSAAGAPTPPAAGAAAPSDTMADDGARATPCRKALADAIELIARQGLDAADALLGDLRARCPDDSRPTSELAGVRFAQGRLAEASTFAARASEMDARDRYAWDVLGSARFLQDDRLGALAAWNHIDKPAVDRVQINGLHRTRYALMTDMLTLEPESVLTPDRFQHAARRLDLLPDLTASGMAYRPDADGFASVDVTVVERSRWPLGPLGWGALGVRALAERQVRTVQPGGLGQGEVWEIDGRWWHNRPRMGLAFVAPRSGWWPGVWHVAGFRERQTYSTAPGALLLSELQTHASVGMTDWLSAGVRYSATAALDQWDDRRDRSTAVGLGAGLERRWLRDRLAVSGSFGHWAPLQAAPTFRAASARVSLRSSIEPAPWVFDLQAGVHAVSASAPLSLWPGAGEGHARDGLLRAHPLVDDGIINGEAFGRRMVSGSVAIERWLARASLVPLGVTAFADLARTEHRLLAGSAPFHVDAGIGIRVKAPGTTGTLRLDYAHGLRDGRHAVTVGWSGAAPLVSEP